MVRGDEKLNPESHFFFLFFPKPVNQLVLVLKPAKVPKLFPWERLRHFSLLIKVLRKVWTEEPIGLCLLLRKVSKKKKKKKKKCVINI